MIYLIHAEGTDFFKIGSSTNPTKRRMRLQIGCPFPLRLLECVEGCGVREARIRRILAAHRVRGEWFSFPEGPPSLAKLLECTA